MSFIEYKKLQRTKKQSFICYKLLIIEEEKKSIAEIKINFYNAEKI